METLRGWRGRGGGGGGRRGLMSLWQESYFYFHLSMVYCLVVSFLPSEALECRGRGSVGGGGGKREGRH